MTSLFIRPTAIVIAAMVGFAAHVAYAEKDAKEPGYGDACTAEGHRAGTFQHLSCVHDKVAAHCADAGVPDSRAFNTCVEDTKARESAKNTTGY